MGNSRSRDVWTKIGCGNIKNINKFCTPRMVVEDWSIAKKILIIFHLLRIITCKFSSHIIVNLRKYIGIEIYVENVKDIVQIIQYLKHMKQPRMIKQ